jgi:A/G-specific adenine glycosylase
MLQQTRVATVLPYFEQWMQRFPTVQALAEAPEEDVLRYWSGLGYYSRARNLQKSARQMNGAFPSDYDTLRQLAGIGDYTAAAIASIAFSRPHAAVDGNVLRVMARLTNDSGDIGAAVTRRRLAGAAGRLLCHQDPGLFNQAVMELGATICLPGNPQCRICPVAVHCESRRAGRQRELPVKLRRTESIHIPRTLILARRRGKILFWQRPVDSSRLAGFWELPEPAQVPEARLGRSIGEFRHTITNHHYLFTICEAFVKSHDKGLRWLRPTPLEYVYSTAARKALKIAGVIGF